MRTSVLTIKDPSGAVLSVEVGDTDELYDHFLAQLKKAPLGTKFVMNHLTHGNAEVPEEDGAP